MPRNYNQPLTPQQRQARNNRRAAMGVGFGLLGAVGLTVAAGTLLFGGHDNAPSDNTGPLDGGVPSASASAMPSTIGTPDTIPTVTPTPSGSETATATSSPAAVDPFLTVRQAIANRYTGCTSNDFNNSGVTKHDGHNRDALHLDLSYDTNGDSADARSNAPKGVTWTSPRIVLRQVVDGKLTDNTITEVTNPGSDQNPGNVTAYMPASSAPGTTYAVMVETSAESPNGNGHNVTTDEWLCGAIGVQDTANNWRPADIGSLTDVQAFYTTESTLPN